MVEDKTMTEIIHLYRTKSENLAHSTKLCVVSDVEPAQPQISEFAESKYYLGIS